MVLAETSLLECGNVCETDVSVSYKRLSNKIVRQVRSRRGEFLSEVTAIAGPEGEPREAFDSAWLRSTVWPEVSDVYGELAIADLFSGSGGLSLGAWEAARALQMRLRRALAVDNDEEALRVYRNNFAPEVSIAADIENCIGDEIGSRTSESEKLLQRQVKNVDLLVAGPPCQGHSDLNNHTRRNDPRNGLIMRAVRFAELFRPRHILIENVQGVRHDREGIFQQAERQLSMLGYQTASFLIDGVDVGIPQKRRRCVLVASRTVTASLARITALQKTPERTFDWACRDLESLSTGGIFNTSARVHEVNQLRMNYLIENDLYDLPNEQRPDCHRLKDHDYTSVYGRLRPNRPSPTITTGFGSPGQGRYTHPRHARTITPHEAARLQFFPDFFAFDTKGRKRLQKLIGNSVPPKLAYSIILDLLANE